MAGPVRTSIIQQRDDGDGIVYTMYGETAGVMQAQAIKVNSTTYGITQGAVVGLGGTINSGSQRPITRLPDSTAMATSRTTYNLRSIDGSLAVTQDSSTLYTKASSGQYAEVEFLTADGSKVLHRNNFEMRIAESG